MCLGALVDVGVPVDFLQAQLAQLSLSSEYQLTVKRVQRGGQQATQVQVKTSGPHPHRHLGEIQQILTSAQLPPQVTTWSLKVFQNLAIAEGSVHGVPPEAVHFHEVGAVDAMIDVVGTCLGLHWLKVDQIYCSALPTGGGTVRAAHGTLPVPVPAVLELWAQRSVPIYHSGIEGELVTPTGAAIAVTLAQTFGPPPAMQIQEIGLGAGQRHLPCPNALRLWLGESPADDVDALEEVIVLETQVDDLNPQGMGLVFDRLLALGALDVWTQAVGMKKQRPGLLISVLCLPSQVEACETILFAETTTLGIRRSHQSRRILKREMQSTETPYGTVAVKVAYLHGRVCNIQPEYEDCLRIAQEQQLSWQQIYQVTLSHWYQGQDR